MDEFVNSDAFFLVLNTNVNYYITTSTLIITRGYRNIDCAFPQITMTELKKNQSEIWYRGAPDKLQPLYSAVSKASKEVKNAGKNNEMPVPFDVPFSFGCQTVNDRKNYGCPGNGRSLFSMAERKLYGHVTDFLIVGAIV